MIDTNQLSAILKQIDIIFKDIEGHKENAQNLLENANRLATIMYNLADMWVEAKHDSDMAESVYEDRYDTAYMANKKKEKMSDESAKALARIECREMYVAQLDKEHLSRKLYTLRSDLDRKISVIQSYAAELRSQFASRRGGEAT